MKLYDFGLSLMIGLGILWCTTAGVGMYQVVQDDKKPVEIARLYGEYMVSSPEQQIVIREIIHTHYKHFRPERISQPSIRTFFVEVLHENNKRSSE